MRLLLQPVDERARPGQSAVEVIDTKEQEEAVARLGGIGACQRGMVVVAPLVETEQDRFIRVEDLREVVMLGSRRPQAEERLVPLETGGHVGHANDRPDALHRVLLYGLTVTVEPRAVVLLPNEADSSGTSSPSLRTPTPLRSSRFVGQMLRQSTGP